MIAGKAGPPTPSGRSRKSLLHASIGNDDQRAWVHRWNTLQETRGGSHFNNCFCPTILTGNRRSTCILIYFPRCAKLPSSLFNTFVGQVRAILLISIINRHGWDDRNRLVPTEVTDEALSSCVISSPFTFLGFRLPVSHCRGGTGLVSAITLLPPLCAAGFIFDIAGDNGVIFEPINLTHIHCPP